LHRLGKIGKSISVCIYLMNTYVEIRKLWDSYCRNEYAVNVAKIFLILICLNVCRNWHFTVTFIFKLP
jgi:hypothetical protein